MIDKKTWINVLPMNQWTSFYNADGVVETRFLLDHYEIVHGVPKLTFKMRNNELIETGVAEVCLTPNLHARLYIPIELHRVPAIGFSPKIVYTFPKGYRIQEYSGELALEEPKPEDVMYEKVRHHTIISRG